MVFMTNNYLSETIEHIIITLFLMLENNLKIPIDIKKKNKISLISCNVL